NISFYRNDYLDILTKSVRATQCDGEDHFSKCIAFAQDPILRRFDTLVVNSGTHPTAGGIDAYRKKMNATSAVLTASMTRLHGENAILVIRNTSPGHSECLKRMFDGPSDPDVAEKLVGLGRGEYQWTTFGDRNKILQDTFRKEYGWKLLHVYSPTHLRSDSHLGREDCLHYCLPGPIDHWVVLLYNV
ncbi:unnamed protein product, partial [Ectocarpus sp. 8 AP-2014]